MIETHVIESLLSPYGLPLVTGRAPDEGARRPTTQAQKSRFPCSQMSVPLNQWDIDDLDSAIDLLNIYGQRRMDSLALLKQNYADCSLTDDETDSDSICDRVVVRLFQSPNNSADFQSSSSELSDTTNTDFSDTLSSPPFPFPAFRKRTSSMAQQSSSVGFSTNPPYSDVLDSSDAGAKKDDFYVVVAEHSDDDERDGERMGSGKGVVHSQLDSSADKGEDDFVVVYAEDGGGEDGEASPDKDSHAVLPTNINGIGSTGASSQLRDSTRIAAGNGAMFRNGRVTAPVVTDTGNFQSLVAMFDGLDNPALPMSLGQSSVMSSNVAVNLGTVSEPISSMASFTSQSVLDSRATPLFPTSQPLPNAGFMSLLGAGTSALNDFDTAISVVDTDPTDGPSVSITSQSAPGGFEEGEPVDTNSSTFLSQVRFFAGRTWAVRGEKVKEAKRQKNIPVGLMNIDPSVVKGGRGRGARGRGRGRGSRGGRGRGGSTATKKPTSPSAKAAAKSFFYPKSPLSPFRISVLSLTKRGNAGTLRGRGGGLRGKGAGSSKKSASPVPSDQGTETSNSAESPVSSGTSSTRGSGRGRGRGRSRGRVFRGRGRGVSRGGKHSPGRGSDSSPVQDSHSPASSRGRRSRGGYSPAGGSLSPASSMSRRSGSSRGRGKYSPASRGAVGDDTLSQASKETSGDVTDKRKSNSALRGLDHISPPFSPLHTRSSDISAKPNRPDYRELSPPFSPLHTRSGFVLGSDSGFGSSPNLSKPALTKKTAGAASVKKKESANTPLSPGRQNRESSVASNSGESSRDISPVVKLVKLTGMEADQKSSSPAYMATKRQHGPDNPGSSPGPSKRPRPGPESSQKMTEEERQESLTKSVGGVMSYLFGENLVGQCPAGFVVNVKLEVEKKKEGETSSLQTCAAASGGEHCCQHNSDNPEECPCLQKLSNSQLAAFLRTQVSKRRDMQTKTRAKILATITHLIQELDNT